MLPPEILALVLLASAASAIQYPQRDPSIANITSPPITTVPTPTDDPASNLEGSTDDCRTTTQCGIFIIPELSSVTGWETEWNPPKTTRYTPVLPDPPQSPDAVVTNAPTVIEIHTNVMPTGAQSPAPNGPGNSRPGSHSSNTRGGGNSPQAPNAPTGPAPASPQHTSGHDLLTDILSRIGKPQPESHPTQPASPTGSSFGPDENQNNQSVPGNENTEQPPPGVTPPPGAQPTVVIGQPITLGPATLTLTPGLSTTVGTGSTATYIGIETNTAGQTVITISSSGTAVTATVTNAPMTMTRPKTGFDASLTEAARPGDNATPASNGDAAVATSSKGAAVHKRGEMEWWIGAVIGVVGMAAVG